MRRSSRPASSRSPGVLNNSESALLSSPVSPSSVNRNHRHQQTSFSNKPNHYHHRPSSAAVVPTYQQPEEQESDEDQEIKQQPQQAKYSLVPTTATTATNGFGHDDVGCSGVVIENPAVRSSPHSTNSNSHSSIHPLTSAAVNILNNHPQHRRPSKSAIEDEEEEGNGLGTIDSDNKEVFQEDEDEDEDDLDFEQPPPHHHLHYHYPPPPPPRTGRRHCRRRSQFSGVHQHTHHPTLYTNCHPAFERRYGGRLPDLLTDFCARTSSHGIPHIAGSFDRFVVLNIDCTDVLETYFTVSTFLMYKTIVEMELKFEAAPFPAVTVCNLNPYKHSSVVGIKEVEQALNQFNTAIDAGKTIKARVPQPSQLPSTVSSISTTPLNPDLNRGNLQTLFNPILAKCRCVAAVADGGSGGERGDGGECVIVRNHSVAYNDPDEQVCMCFQDTISGSIWPCYHSDRWTEEKCEPCTISNSCPFPEDKSNRSGTLRFPCLCQDISRLDLFEVLGKVQDTGSITTKTKENIILIVAGKSAEEREKLSYKLDEFVFSCTFNTGPCDFKRDFKLHLDPAFGNCYSFNWNDSVTLKNTRAGPMYGLRLLLNVNQTDYLPSTEAAGIRLVVHEQDDEPFPDTFGYSAPTGSISSFGLKTKVVNRLGPPYGRCVKGFRPENYIYNEFYSTEGCYRNCFQHEIIRRCGCGDPRFPLPPNVGGCRALHREERSCLENGTRALGGYYTSQQDCVCVQPCQENVFETAYSAADWPAKKYKTGECPPHIHANDTKACTEYFRKQRAAKPAHYPHNQQPRIGGYEMHYVANTASSTNVHYSPSQHSVDTPNRPIAVERKIEEHSTGDQIGDSRRSSNNPPTTPGLRRKLSTITHSP